GQAGRRWRARPPPPPGAPATRADGTSPVGRDAIATGCALPALTAVNAPSAQHVALSGGPESPGRARRSGAGRVVLAAAVAGGAMARGLTWFVGPGHAGGATTTAIPAHPCPF